MASILAAVWEIGVRRERLDVTAKNVLRDNIVVLESRDTDCILILENLNMNSLSVQLVILEDVVEELRTWLVCVERLGPECKDFWCTDINAGIEEVAADIEDLLADDIFWSLR